MITGIGCDVVELNRIESVLAKHGQAFIEKVLSPSEIITYYRRSAANPKRGVMYLASRWAAKEAFSKALGTGLRNEVTLTDISVENNELGAPYLVFTGKLSNLVQNLKINCFISISDTDTVCMAMAVCERNSNG